MEAKCNVARFHQAQLWQPPDRITTGGDILFPTVRIMPNLTWSDDALFMRNSPVATATGESSSQPCLLAR
jgi:hypothetical protein